MIETGENRREPIRREMKLANGMVRPWYEYVSPKAKEGVPVPLVFCLHGGEGDGYHAFICGNLKAVADCEPMMIVSPLIEDTPRSFEWNAESEVIEIAKEFYDNILKLYAGRYDKIFIMGYSIGEYLAFQFLRKYSDAADAFAGAVAPVPGKTFCGEDGRPFFYADQKPIPAFLWRGTQDYLYSIYTVGHADEAVQCKVIKEHKDYWKAWNHVENAETSETEEYVTEKYTDGRKPLIHVLAKGKRHEDEADVFRMAWTELFSVIASNK